MSPEFDKDLFLLKFGSAEDAELPVYTLVYAKDFAAQQSTRKHQAEQIKMGPPRFELGSPAPQAGRITRLPYGPFKEGQG